ncbi:MAG: VWA domain-containing protein [bacterium]|nr:VWA domain-containing protein [bacterium]
MVIARRIAVFGTLGLLAVLAPPLPAIDADVGLPKRYREWLEQVEVLITDEERAYFLTLQDDFRRNAFIDAFWNERDPDPDTPFNELRIQWDERVAAARSRFGSLDKDERSHFLLRYGEPDFRCRHRTVEIEIWAYGLGDDPVILIFYKISRDAPYRQWLPPITLVPTTRHPPLLMLPVREACSGELLGEAMKKIAGDVFYQTREPRTMEIPEPSKEWVASFASQSTDLPDGVGTFAADLAFEFPGRHQQRTVVQGLVAVERAAAAVFGDGTQAHHQFLLTGEVVHDDQLFESFRYRFEIPVAEGTAAPIALAFQRVLRPGHARLIVKLEDLYGHRFARVDRRIEIPNVEQEAGRELTGPLRADSELFRFLAEANAATARGELSLRLLLPPRVIQSGLVRFKTLAVGEFERVDFLLDDQRILSKLRPPYSVELDLGDVPAMHRLRVNGYDEKGRPVATDEIILNPGGQRFRVRLIEPRRGRRYRHSLRAVVQTVVPDGGEVERVELYLNEDRVATLYQPPFTQPILLGGEELTYVRAVAYLADGNSNEDLVFVNAPGNLEEIQVNFVELYATVYDRRGRPVRGLAESDFQVLEDGKLQQARRFEWVDDLPLHTTLMIDTSASMEDSIETVGEAALAFVEQAIEPRDRASLISFNHQPQVEARFTNDVDTLARKLKALRATGGTALYDSLVFTLHYFHGVKGQKALLLLSDGRDESSEFDFDETLEFARRAGVMIYAIGLEDAELKRDARRVLEKLAAETGGRAFFVRELDELEAIYTEIQEELRSQYLFAYQSSSEKDPSQFRRIEVIVELDGKRAEVNTMSGYYP